MQSNSKYPITALVLAAGFSSRMNAEKTTLPLNDGTSFQEAIVCNLKEVGLKHIAVIHRGSFSQRLSDVKYILNPKPEKGMLYSIQLGVQSIDEDTESIMIYPVDMPLVDQNTLDLLCMNSDSDKIVLPKYKGKRGHPILIGRNFFDDLMSAPLDIGARYVVYENKSKIKEISVSDKGITINVNTPKIYNKIINNSSTKEGNNNEI